MANCVHQCWYTVVAATRLAHKVDSRTLLKKQKYIWQITGPHTYKCSSESSDTFVFHSRATTKNFMSMGHWNALKLDHELIAAASQILVFKGKTEKNKTRRCRGQICSSQQWGTKPLQGAYLDISTSNIRGKWINDIWCGLMNFEM